MAAACEASERIKVSFLTSLTMLGLFAAGVFLQFGRGRHEEPVGHSAGGVAGHESHVAEHQFQRRNGLLFQRRRHDVVIDHLLVVSIATIRSTR